MFLLCNCIISISVLLLLTLVCASVYLSIQWKKTKKQSNKQANKQTNGKHHHFFIQIQIRGHVLVHSDDKTHVLVATVELVGLLFLNIFLLNFVPTPNKFLRLKGFRRNYVNRTAVVLTSHYQSYTAFLLDVQLFVPIQVRKI